MKKIISDIHNAEQNSRKTIEFLIQNSSWSWIGEYPISIVNEISRITNEEDLKNLEKINFFDAEGFSKNSYSPKEIEYLIQDVPSAIKTAYCLCLKKKPAGNYIFKEKSQNDHWKKVTDEQNFEALVESTKFKDSDSVKVIENALRDIMQGAKDIPSLKNIGFAWIVTVPKTTNVEAILNHYFLDNHIFIEKGRKITYIGWADKLVDINMRTFANNP
ncbi:hypothetical protein GJV85_08995 [Sulfurimonas aquatica]|uniref:Uncharacterized protein n=1 Tax=Sulfurimonas aquatica TaxID=2672570 RepID=A0A975B0Z6_9BACT|nr:hypothetical protein [Sulfurimonas aquatica]QSZ42236.1 hypothetical protein GJV85_08995 [Sulfurimonas aquatica]